MGAGPAGTAAPRKPGSGGGGIPPFSGNDRTAGSTPALAVHFGKLALYGHGADRGGRRSHPPGGHGSSGAGSSGSFETPPDPFIRRGPVRRYRRGGAGAVLTGSGTAHGQCGMDGGGLCFSGNQHPPVSGRPGASGTGERTGPLRGSAPCAGENRRADLQSPLYPGRRNRRFAGRSPAGTGDGAGRRRRRPGLLPGHRGLLDSPGQARRRSGSGNRGRTGGSGL